jgi:CrcB protein
MKKAKITREIITQKAIELFAQNGIDNVSMNEIAKELGVTKPVIYYYFKMQNLVPFILVGVGGFFGAIARYVVAIYFSKNTTLYFPFATFLVNILGCFMIGFLSYVAIYVKILEPEYIRYFFSIGFVGAFTTFSTFELEIYNLIGDKAIILALIYVFSSLIIGFLAVK